jgi:hypothetical protein
MVIIDAPTDYIGALVKVRVESASPHTLFGRVADVVSPARTPSTSRSLDAKPGTFRRVASNT